MATLVLASEATSFHGQGWIIRVDPDHDELLLEHERLGVLLEGAQLGVDEARRFLPAAQWKTEVSSPSRFIIRTGQPAILWSFETGSNALTISSTAPGAVIVGSCPVSKSRRVARLLDREGTPIDWHGTGEVAGGYGGSYTRNLSFLPRRNPECMYLGLGQVSGSVFHCLFDQASDTAIEFPEQTRFVQNGSTNALKLTLPLPGPAQIRLSPDYFTRVLGVPYYVPFDDSIFPSAPMVWCSWTSYYGDVTEEGIVKNTDWLAENLKPYGFRYVQIDDGYDRSPKEGHYWIEHWDRNKFPKGPEWITQYIKSKGLHAGLWLVPNAFAGAVAKHPDWYLRDRNGNIVLDYGTPALDSSNPEVLEFLKTLFTTLKNWGFDYYKFDGEHALPKYAPTVDTSRLFDKAADPLQVYRHRLEVIRQIIGPETFIEGCPAGTPLNGIGYCNSYFNGQDVYNNWHGMYSLFSSINANAFLNHVVVYVMPGEGLELGERLTVEEAGRRRPTEVIETARSREAPLIGLGVTTAEARTLVSLVSMSGVVYPLAGVMPELPKDRLALLQKTMPTMPIMPLDLFSRGGDTDWDTFKHVKAEEFIHNFPEILDLKVKAESGDYDVVAVPNWRKDEVIKTVSLENQLGLEPGDYVAFDFWNQKLLGRCSDRLTLQVAGHDTLVILLHRLQAHPQLLGISRHITGVFSVSNLKYDLENHELSGAVEVVPGENYTLFIHVPPGRWGKPKVSARQDQGQVQRTITKEGELLSVTLKAERSPVAWQVRF